MNNRITTRLSLVSLLWVCGFVLEWHVRLELALLLFAGGLAVPSSRYLPNAKSRLFRFLSFALIFFSLLVLVNGLLIRTGGVAFTVLGLGFSRDGLFFALETASRLLLLAVSLLLLFAFTSIRSLAGYVRSLGLPVQLSYVILLTLHFLEQLPDRSAQILLAQQARGAATAGSFLGRSKAFFSILAPLVLSSIVETTERGVALELRGIHRALDRHTGKTPTTLTTASFLIFVLALVLLFIGFMKWLTR